MAKQITVADLQSPENPGDGWYIIEAAGEYPKTVRDAANRPLRIVQRLTPEALARIAENGVPEEGLLIDRDHRSLTHQPDSEAMGWVRELATCEGNLAARIEWTPMGQQLIAGKAYKHFSTVYPPDAEQFARGELTPAKLAGLSLTNTPNNAEGQPPIANSAEPEEQKEQALQPGGNAPADSRNQQEKTNMEYPAELLNALGLAEGASDEEVLAAVQKLQEENHSAKDAAAEAVINSEEAAAGTKLNDEERKECKEALVANSKLGAKFTHLVCNAKRAEDEPLPPVANSAVVSPEPSIFGEPKQAKHERADKARALMESERAAGRNLSFAEAWDRVEA